MSHSIEKAVKNKIFGHGRGWCFTSRHFLALGNDLAVRQALFQLHRQKMIRRLCQGLYDYPRQHDLLGLIPPDPNLVAQALAFKNGNKIQPSGAYAANLIGISEQVPGRVVFLTNGKAKKIKIGKSEITFKKASMKTMYASGTKEGLVIQSFKFMKKENINQTVREKTRRFLQDRNKKELIKNLKYAPVWIRSLILEIMEKEK